MGIVTLKAPHINSQPILQYRYVTRKKETIRMRVVMTIENTLYAKSSSRKIQKKKGQVYLSISL